MLANRYGQVTKTTKLIINTKLLTMNTFENEFSNTTTLAITPEIKDYLIETSKWGKFLAIMGYIGIGLMVLLAIFMMIGLSAFPTSAMIPTGAIGFFYLVLAALYFMPVRYLQKFSEEIRSGITSEDNVDFVSGFRNLKSLFKFLGIMTIVMISLYILMIIGMVVFFSTRAF
jgi:hypothetical protein